MTKPRLIPKYGINYKVGRNAHRPKSRIPSSPNTDPEVSDASSDFTVAVVVGTLLVGALLYFIFS